MDFPDHNNVLRFVQRRAKMSVGIEKHSPFILRLETLDQLCAASDEPAVLDLVGGYKAAQETLDFYTEQVIAELNYYGVPTV